MKSLKRMGRFMSPYRWVFVLMLLTVVLPVMMELVVPRMLQVVVDKGIRAGDMGQVWRGSLIMLGTALIGSLTTLGQGICRAQLSQGIAYDLRNALFARIQQFSFGNLDSMQTGQLMTRISSDVDVVRMFSSAGLSLLLRALLMIVGSVVMIVLIDWRLSLVMFGLLAIAAVIITAFMNRASPLFVVVQEKLSALNTLVQENLAGVQVVKAFVREPFEIQQFEVSNIEYRDQHIRVGRLLALVLPLLMVVTNVGVAIVLWLGGVDVIEGRLSIGELIAFNNYLMIAMAPLLMLSNILTMVSRAEASSERIFTVLDTEPLIQAMPSPYHSDRLRGRVVFDNVSFRYDNANGSNAPDGILPANGASRYGGGEVLDGVSFTVEPGERVALLGATGSGKSTLVSLLPRFYDVTDGRILIDDVDVREWAPDDLRGQVGTVLQQTTLFSGTVRENIAYGRPDATLDDVMAAARAAQAHDFIMAMPDGYDSVVEAHGANLSGGQKQRIAIARALLVSPGILILDDSTSAVDLETEVQIQDALDRLSRDMTTFIVAQRINSVLSADQIMVLDIGRIAARGTHRELINTSPIYQDIYRSQFGEDGYGSRDSGVGSRGAGA